MDVSPDDIYKGREAAFVKGFLLYLKTRFLKPGVVRYTCNFNNLKIEAEGLQGQGQPGVQTLSQNKPPEIFVSHTKLLR